MCRKKGIILFALALTRYPDSSPAQPAHRSLHEHQAPASQASMDALAVVDVVAAFIAAGESNDAGGRTAYLAGDVFFYGHRRTRTQASKEIARLYRLWPTRKFTCTEKVAVFAIPNHAGVYKATTVIEYKMVNRYQDQISGKSRITCIVEKGRDGVRIIGVDEKLLPVAAQADQPAQRRA